MGSHNQRPAPAQRTTAASWRGLGVWVAGAMGLLLITWATDCCGVYRRGAAGY